VEEERDEVADVLQEADPATVCWTARCLDCKAKAVGVPDRAAARQWRIDHIVETDGKHLVLIELHFKTKSGGAMGFWE
jgi:hypothetical protein